MKLIYLWLFVFCGLASAADHQQLVSTCANSYGVNSASAEGYARFIRYPGKQVRLHLFNTSESFERVEVANSFVVLPLEMMFAEQEKIEGRQLKVNGIVRCLTTPDSLIPVTHITNAAILAVSVARLEIKQEPAFSWKKAESSAARGLLVKWINAAIKKDYFRAGRLLEANETTNGAFANQRLR
jgi:hypothetical protein